MLIPLRLMLVSSVCLTWVPASSSAEEITNAFGMKFRLLEAGRYERGEGDPSPGFYKDHAAFNPGDDRPVHPVVLTKPFYMATTEVALGQFRQFQKDTGYKTSAEKSERGAVGWDPNPPADNPRYVSTFRDGGGFEWRHPGFEQEDNHPVTGVSFHDAKAFCEWLSKKEDATYRLPTEAEWEYAARAGTKTYFSFGNTYRGTIHRFANIANVELEKAFPDRVRRLWLVDVERDPVDAHVFTAPVGSYAPNPWGLYDMHGNVWEWCEDRYLDTAYAAYTRPGYQQVRKRAFDPVNLEKSADAGDWRVIRGGSWFSPPIQCKSSVRGFFEAEDAACYIGFRVVREATPERRAAARMRIEQSEAARETITRLLGANNIQERRDGRLSLLIQIEHLTEEFYTALAALDEPVDLHLHGRNRLTGEIVASLSKARNLCGLQIWEAGSEVVDEDFAFLAEHPELELLQIAASPKLTDGLFQHLQKHDRLELLHLESERITDAGLSLLPRLEKLQTLFLRGTASEGRILERFQHSPLKNFSCNRLSDATARSLGHFKRLQSLELAGSPLSGISLKVISQLPWVADLGLTGCANLRDEDFAAIGNLYELKSLRVNQTSAGDLAAKEIARLNNLRNILIGSPNLSDDGLRKISGMVSLQHLIVTKEATHLTDAGFSDCWRLVNLQSLSVEAPQITGSGFGPIAELPRLDWMSLSGRGITDAALKHAAESKSLKRLSVGGWQAGGPPALSDLGILHLAKSPALTKFELHRKDTKVTDQGLKQLREQRPQLEVNER